MTGFREDLETEPWGRIGVNTFKKRQFSLLEGLPVWIHGEPNLSATTDFEPVNFDGYVKRSGSFA